MSIALCNRNENYDNRQTVLHQLYRTFLCRSPKIIISDIDVQDRGNYAQSTALTAPE